MNGPLNNPAGQASRSRHKGKKLPAHVDWRDKMGVISKVKNQVNSIKQEAMENFVFPDEIETKLMKMRKLMNIFYVP